MTFVITGTCCNDASCIPVCPVQCIRPRPGDPDFMSTEQLYIDPGTCIDCAACFDECPVEAIYPDYDVPEDLEDYLQVNADYFEENPLGDTTPLPANRRRLPEERPSLRVAVVGAGPSACYAVDEISSIKGVEVTVFDRLPTPFGLVRSGVAPDHTRTKLINDRFHTVLSRKNVTCFFNTEVGRDVSIEEILNHHHAVIYAGGAGSDRRLGIDGEDLPGSHSAREFVAWYNGHPEHANDSFDLRGERVVIIGNGNVALDVARALTQPIEVYEKTDMADHAIEALRSSGVREVIVAARRGQAHGAYSTAELSALAGLDGVDLLAEASEIGIEDSELATIAPDGLTADLRRRFGVVEAAAARTPNDDNRRITLRFRSTPVAIEGADHVEAITFEHPDGSTERIETSLVLRAIGYTATAVDGLPFDDKRGIVPNDGGRVIASDTAEPVTGLYCTGWIKRGANGIIGTNRTDSAETIAALLADFESGTLPDPQADAEALADLVNQRNPDVVDAAGWTRINAAEKAAGKPEKRSRVKFVSIDEMLTASRI